MRPSSVRAVNRRRCSASAHAARRRRPLRSLPGAGSGLVEALEALRAGGTRWALRTDLEPEVNRSRCGTRPIPALVRDLDVKARGLSRGWEGLAVIDVRPTPSISSVAISLEVSSDLPAKAAQTARRFLDQVLDLMRDEGNIFKSASRELACA